ncbi:MAG TPA: hypothetical protein VIM03_02900 [Thermoleophilaceae bacterium]
MPRKFLVTALALIVATALVGVAYAANVYNITVGSTSPAGKGSKSKPLPVSEKFGYTVKDSTQPRGKPVTKYKIAIEGITNKYAKHFPKCKYADANGADYATKCAKAKFGSGKVENLAGPNNDQSNNTFCNLGLVLYNLGNGVAIRLDGGPPAPSSQSGPVGCLLAVHQAINAKFKTVTIDKESSTSLEFTVPRNLRHPLPKDAQGNETFDNVVANTVANIKKKVTKVKIKGKKRKVGLYSAIGCHGKNRTVKVTFTDETPKSSTYTKKTKKC